MRRLMRGTAATAVLALTALVGLPAGPAGARALPKPRNEEWQFAAWEIEDKVWPMTRGQGVTIAVVDTGVNASLPGLQGVVKPGADVRTGGSGDGRTDTDTTNGGHGTGMAELIAGQGQDDGMLGIAPDAKIMPIIVDGSSEAAGKAIRFAVDHGAQVVNFSLANPDDAGTTCAAASGDRSLQEAVAYAAQKKVVVVAAAGNQGNTVNDPMFPADCAGVLAVGAVDHKKVPWVNTERQSYVAVAAPGYGVGTVDKAGHFMGNLSGTSQASALTSGVVALVRAKYPQLSAREVVQRIVNSTVDAGQSGRDDQTGAGIVIPTWALSRDVPTSAPNPPYQRLDQWLASAQGKASGATPSKSGKSAEKSNSGSNTGLVIAIVAVVLVAIVIVVVLLARRRGRGSRPVVHEQPPGQGPYGRYPPGGPQDPSGTPGPYGTRDPYAQGPYGPQGEDRYDSPGSRPGPPPSFLPPDHGDQPPH